MTTTKARLDRLRRNLGLRCATCYGCLPLLVGDDAPPDEELDSRCPGCGRWRGTFPRWIWDLV